jgi:iron(III) transport system substrate-binding protein
MNSKLLLVLVCCALTGAGLPVQAVEVNIYSERKEELIKPLLDRFTTETGIKVNLVTGEGDALIKRLEIEGGNSPADILLATDVARLYRARSLGLLQPVQSDMLANAIPGKFRDGEGYWFGLSLRSRVIVYAKDRVQPDRLSTYEALAGPEWKGRICVRSSSNPYNQSLVASMIARKGVEATEEWARGLVNNFARAPKGGDRDQIKAVAVGECDVALVNTYYLGGMLHSGVPDEKEAAEKTALFWPNQNDRGAHFNVSGAGVTRAAKNRDAAIRLLEFLAGDEAQAWYAQVNYEFPVSPGVAVSETLKQWGDFIADDIRLDQLGQYNAEAVRLMDRAGWK